MRKYLSTIIVLILMILFVCNFRFLIVEGESMTPTFRDKNICIGYKNFKDINVDDVVVFYAKELHTLVIKRVVAVEGTEWVYYNPVYKYFDTATVEPGKVFVEGDNYFDSVDSRFPEVGQVPIDDIQCKVVFNFNNLPLIWYLGFIIFIILINMYNNINDEEKKDELNKETEEIEQILSDKK